MDDTAFAETHKPNEEVDILPWGKCMPSYLMSVADAIAVTILHPLFPAMLEERWGITSAGDKSFYIGLMDAGIWGGKFIASFSLGYLSDHVGRQPLMLLASISILFSTLCVGLSPWLWPALLARLVFSSVNCGLSVGRALLADVTEDRSDKVRAVAFAYNGAAYSLTRAISAALGGFLSEINFFDEETGVPWDRFFTPVLFAGIIQLLIAVYMGGWVPNSRQDSSVPNFRTGFQQMMKSRDLAISLFIHWFGSFGNGGYLDYMVIFTNTALSFSSKEIGFQFAYFGGLAALFQFTMFKKLLAYTGGIRASHRIGVLGLLFSALLIPISCFMDARWMQWAMLCVVGISPGSVGFMLNLPMAGAIVTNAIGKRNQGMIQGFNASISSVFRMLGAFLISYSYGFSDEYFLWFTGIINALPYIVAFIMNFYLSADVETGVQSSDEELEEVKVSPSDLEIDVPNFDQDEGDFSCKSEDVEESSDYEQSEEIASEEDHNADDLY